MSNIVPFSTGNGVLDTSKNANNTAQEVNNLSDFLELEFEKYSRNKILYDVIQECVKSSSCKESLRNKVIGKMMSASCSQCLDIECSGKGASQLLLGTDLKSEELTYTESIDLKNLISGSLKSKYKEICDGFFKMTGKNVEDIPTNVKTTSFLELSLEEKVLLLYKQELTFEQNLYISNLFKKLELLEEVSKLRLNTLPETTEQKIRECQIKSQMHQLRSRLAQEKVRVDIFTETNKSLDAYKQLIKDIKEQQEECRKEVEDLLELKEKYKAVSCKQFDDILKSFLQYKTSIEKKKLLYNCLNS